ncbi:Glycine-tRNA ligase [Heracleum sosnowskyi]|uniref:Glycine-tRNA ligase n=1 Tax=Heracleum sosnowskyi TaxID=360622 RepID=A0AAD8HDM1_9APIA|nr:Glycine-tRNA ligase [Heracleum sosnowskyi]
MASIHLLASPKLKQLLVPLAVSQSQPPPPPHRALPFRISSSNNKEKKRLLIKCQAAADDSSSQPLFQGIYGPWSVDSDDVREVILYRSGLVTAAASFVFSASTAFLPDHSFLADLIKPNFDFLYALGAAGLGLSLFLIHIYVTEIKRTLQLLWGLGVLGSIATSFTLAEPAGQNLVQYVVDHPTAVWLVGPLFAAFTGLVFKEGLCYGKLEAGVLTFVVPAVLLGHLTGLMDDGLKTTLLGLWMALFVVFAGRKFTQPIKDDIGDKSVFIFNSLPEEEKKLNNKNWLIRCSIEN